MREVRFKISDDVHGSHNSHKHFDKEHRQNLLIDYVKELVESPVDADINEIIKAMPSKEKLVD